MATKNVIVIPNWLHSKLQHNNIKLTSIGDYSVISKVLCTEELASIYALTRLVYELPMFKRCSDIFSTDLWVGDDSINQQLSQSKDILDELKTRLTLPPTDYANTLPNDTPTQVIDKESVYKLADADRETAVLVIYPGFFEAIESDNLKYSLYKRLLELFYVYFGVDKCFKMRMYGNYIRILAKLNKVN